MRFRKEHATLQAEGKPSDGNRLRVKWAERRLAALRDRTAPTSVPAELQLLRLGTDIALFTLPGELFVEVRLKIKQAVASAGASASRGAFVVAYANGYTGYLPSRRAEEWGWCAHDDSYEGTPDPANLSGAIEEALVAAAQELLREVKL